MDTPQQIAESFRWPLASGEHFAASISGPRGSGKTEVLAQLIEIVVDLDWDLADVAAFAPTHRAARHLRTLATRPWPLLEEDRLLADHLTGTPYTALLAHTVLPGDSLQYYEFVHAYLEHLAHLNALDCDNPQHIKFLKSLWPRLRAGLRVEHAARYADAPLARNAFLHTLAAFLAAYKRDYGFLDLADLVHADYYTSPNVRLLLLDEIDSHNRQLLEPIFPNAVVIATNLAAGDLSLTCAVDSRNKAVDRAA